MTVVEEVTELRRANEQLIAEVERLKREGSPGIMHEVDKAFHKLAIKERDHAWVQGDRYKAAHESTQHGLIRMEQQRDELRTAILRVAGIDPNTANEDTDYVAALTAEVERLQESRIAWVLEADKLEQQAGLMARSSERFFHANLSNRQKVEDLEEERDSLREQLDTAVVLPPDWETQVRQALAARAGDIREAGPAPGAQSLYTEHDCANEIAEDITALIGRW